MENDQTDYTVLLYVYGELADFLRNELKGDKPTYRFAGRRSVKDLIESLGIPHTEVGSVRINDELSGFERIVVNQDKIEVSPRKSSYDFTQPSHLMPDPIKEVRFLLDVHLGTLSRRLRLLGFDTDYRSDRDDPELAQKSSAEKRILLTRDRRLLMRKNVKWGMFIRNKYPLLQTAEVLNMLGLWDDIKVFTRCIACNGILYTVLIDSKEYLQVLNLLPEGVTCWCKEYVRCDTCLKIYWKGSHFDKMEKELSDLYSYRETG